MKEKKNPSFDQGNKVLSNLFHEFSNADLVMVFNSEVETEHWVRTRAVVLGLLGEELQSRGLDCSSIIQDGTMYLKAPVKLVGKSLVITPAQPPVKLQDSDMN